MNGMDSMAEMAGMEGFGGLFDVGARGGRIAMPLCDRTLNGEVSVDAVLPDYLPEIRRVLTVRADLMPPAKYAGGAKVEYNGTVDYRILYVSAQGELCSAPLSGEYEFEAPLETAGREFDLNEGICTLVSTVTDSISTRLSGPRRVSLRHRMTSHVRAFGQMLLPDEGEQSDTVCRLTAEAECTVPASGMSDYLEFEDSCPLPSEQTRVVTAEPSVFVSTVTVRDGAVQTAGEITVKLLCMTDGSCETMVRRIPFDGVIEGEFSAGASACAEGRVCELKVVVEEGMISCTGSLLLTARSFAPRTLRYTRDLYATDRGSSCEQTVLEVPVSLRCENRNFSQSERIPLAEAGLPDGAEILDAWGEGKVERCEGTAGRTVLTGQMRYLMLCQSGGDYSVCEILMPLRYESDLDGAEACDGTLSVISCRARTDGDTLCLDAELLLCADYSATESMTCVSNVRMGEPCQTSTNRMIIYYPTPGDTPWSVAKKYRVPPESLKGDISSYFVL